jgi:hypothetical protein
MAHQEKPYAVRLFSLPGGSAKGIVPELLSELSFSKSVQLGDRQVTAALILQHHQSFSPFATTKAVKATLHAMAHATRIQDRVVTTIGISAATPPTAIMTNRTVAIHPSREPGSRPHPNRVRRNQ